MEGDRRHSTIATALALVAVMVTIALIADGPVDEVAADETGNYPQLSTAYMRLKSTTTMSPEPHGDANHLTATIPNGFVKDGPMGRGILPFMGHVYWRDVGTWATDPVRDTINLGGEVRIVIFAVNEQSAVNCDFEFIISRANEANPLLQINRNGLRINQAPTRIEAIGNFPRTNDTTIQTNSQLALRIRARCNGGATLLFGSSEYDTGFTLDSNALKPLSLNVDQQGFVMEYKDAFLVNWRSLHKKLTVNSLEEPNTNIESDRNAVNDSRLLRWPKENTPGTFEMSCSLSYDQTGLGNVSLSEVKKISAVKVDPLAKVRNAFFSNIYLIAFIILLLALALFLRRQRKRTWKKRVRTLSPQERELSPSKQRKAWKKHNRAKRDERKRSRKQVRQQSEEENLDAGFSLFRKSPKAAPKTSRRRARPAMVVEEDTEGNDKPTSDAGMDLADLEL